MALDITMSHRIELPGGWAELRPVSDITERMRRPIKRASTKLTSFPSFMAAVRDGQKATEGGRELTPDEQAAIAVSMGEAFDVLEDVQDLLVVAAVRGWSWDFPVTQDTILDLPTPALDALRKAVAPYQGALNPKFEPTPEESPTEPSSA